MTKTLCTFIRTLSVAALLAAAALSLPTLEGHAQAESQCTPATCGTKSCRLPGTSKTYTGGDTITGNDEDGKLVVYMCDGFTGRWIQIAIRTQTPTRGPWSPVAPLPGVAVLSAH